MQLKMVAGDVGLVLFSTPESSQDYNQKKKIPIAPVVSEEIMKIICVVYNILTHDV